MSSDLAGTLREMIADGHLVAGERVAEEVLARSLEVSRTPLREALARLAADGFVEHRPRFGFYVQTLDAGTVRQLFQVRAALVPAALALAGLPDHATRKRLRLLTRDMRRARGDPETTMDMDNEWLLALLSKCANRLLLDLIERVTQRIRPAARAYLRQDGGMEAAFLRIHERVGADLARRDLDLALATLRQEMRAATERIVAWLEAARPACAEMRRR
ncbi:MAG: GntR family transcriptional regulator [Gemmatimonadota bacterium]